MTQHVYLPVFEVTILQLLVSSREHWISALDSWTLHVRSRAVTRIEISSVMVNFNSSFDFPHLSVTSKSEFLHFNARVVAMAELIRFAMLSSAHVHKL